MRRPPKPDVRAGDVVEVQVCAWHDDEGGRTERSWRPTGTTFVTVAGDVVWDRWAGGWQVDLSKNPHHGRVRARYVRVLEHVVGWDQPELDLGTSE